PARARASRRGARPRRPSAATRHRTVIEPVIQAAAPREPSATTRTAGVGGRDPDQPRRAGRRATRGGGAYRASAVTRAVRTTNGPGRSPPDPLRTVTTSWRSQDPMRSPRRIAGYTGLLGI